MQQSSADYPLQGTRAQVMLENAMKAAQASGRSQRDVAAELGYKTSVVLSHMTAGRVPIPVDRETAALVDKRGAIPSLAKGGYRIL